jgi:RimJ/RimL family protein N-acetyltransferase
VHSRSIVDGSRIRLVALERAHLPKRVSFINDPEVQASLNFDYPTSLARTEAWFGKNILAASRVDFAIEAVNDGVTIGFCGLINLDLSARKAELYIFIGEKDYWGGGYGRDGYKLLTNYGFIELGLERVYGYQLDDNVRATKAFEKIGWSVEGKLRNDLWSHGQLRSRYIVSILRDEWLAHAAYDET